jgi:hypothetical protein
MAEEPEDYRASSALAKILYNYRKKKEISFSGRQDYKEPGFGNSQSNTPAE